MRHAPVPAEEGQRSSGATWRICHELVAPLMDMSRTGNVQIRASYFYIVSNGV